MGISTPPFSPILSHFKTHFRYLHHHHRELIRQKSNSMSQDYHRSAGIFAFSNGFDEQHHHQQQQQSHLAQQIRRDKLRIQPGYDPPSGSLLGMEDEESGGLTVYETAGMLSEMFNFTSGGGPATTAELLNQPLQSNFRPPWQRQDWYSNSNRQGITVGGLSPLGDSKNHHHHHQISSINEDSAAAMQLFLTNPPPRSPSPPPPPPSLQGFTEISPPQFTWPISGSSHEGGNNPSEIGRVMEGQGLSLSLSSTLQHLEAAKVEELRMRDSGFFYYNQGNGGSSSSSSSQYYKNLSVQQQQQQQLLHLQSGQNHQVHFGFGSSLGMVNVLRNSKYVKAAQDLLEEFCSVGRGQFKKNKFSRQNINPISNNLYGSSGGGSSSGGGGNGSGGSSRKDLPPLSAADRIEHQRRKVKLLSMLDEVDRRYNNYCEQMQMVMNSFDLVMGFGAAVPYTTLAHKAMSRHFRCLKDTITAQLKHSSELLGEKNGTVISGITKGETPRLKLLERSLRQQKSFHQMGIMEQEAWRPQRGLPERSVNLLRAWLFEHFLHPYPSDADKHLLARQTSLSRNQVSNWFINARVRLWKPMVEEMYQQEAKEGEDLVIEDKERKHFRNNKNNRNNNGPPQSPPPITSPQAAAAAAGKRSENANENDPSQLLAIDTQCFSDNKEKQHSPSTTTTTTTTIVTSTSKEVAPPLPLPPPPPSIPLYGQSFDETCRRGSMVADDFGTTSSYAGHHHIGSTLVRFATTAAGDVSLTLGLPHAGNMSEKTSAFSVRNFGNS